MEVDPTTNWLTYLIFGLLIGLGVVVILIYLDQQGVIDWQLLENITT